MSFNEKAHTTVVACAQKLAATRVSRAVASKLAQGALAGGEASTAGKYFGQCSDIVCYQQSMVVLQQGTNM